MTTEQIIIMIVGMLPGIAAIIGLIIALVNYVKKAVKEKNWGALLSYVSKMMAEAEELFFDGVDKKEWVIEAVKTSAEYINYPIDDESLSILIDSLCDLTNQVNYTPVVKDDDVK